MKLELDKDEFMALPILIMVLAVCGTLVFGMTTCENSKSNPKKESAVIKESVK